MNVAPGLVDSCLNLGLEPSAFAEQLMAWLCETEFQPLEGDEEDEGAEPSALFALLLLRAADNPSDSRIAPLTRMLTEHPWCSPAELNAILAESQMADLWADLIRRILVHKRQFNFAIDQLLVSLGPL